VKSNGAVTASGCELKNDVNIDMNNDTWKAFADTVNFTYDVATNIVVPAMTLTASPPTPKPTPKPTTPPPSPTKGDWQLCSTSTECQNQCCSSKYSDGVLKCTPVGGFKTSEGCVGSSTSTTKLGEWEQCSNSAQCQNQCCSSKYSDGVLKCTPVGGFKTSEGCVGSATRRLRGNNEDGVLAADETNTTFMHHAAPVEELGRDVEYGDELN
jgi:hypothetical protein